MSWLKRHFPGIIAGTIGNAVFWLFLAVCSAIRPFLAGIWNQPWKWSVNGVLSLVSIVLFVMALVQISRAIIASRRPVLTPKQQAELQERRKKAEAETMPRFGSVTTTLTLHLPTRAERYQTMAQGIKVCENYIDRLRQNTNLPSDAEIRHAVNELAEVVRVYANIGELDRFKNTNTNVISSLSEKIDVTRQIMERLRKEERR